MSILMVSGKRGSGKSLLAGFLEQGGYVKVSLARPLKDFCKQEFKLTEEQVNGCLKESPTTYRRTDGSFLTGRDIMIRTGIYFRSIDPLYFCRKLHIFMNHMIINEGNVNFVIDDLRFINEIEFFKKFNARFARLERKQELNVYKAALDDLSESELDTFKNWDFKLSEEKNLTELDMSEFAKVILSSPPVTEEVEIVPGITVPKGSL